MEVDVYYPEISVQHANIKLPPLYMEYNGDTGVSYSEWERNERNIKKYLKKKYKRVIKQIVIDAIKRGDIKIDITIDDSDLIDIDNISDNDIVSWDEIK